MGKAKLGLGYGSIAGAFTGGLKGGMGFYKNITDEIEETKLKAERAEAEAKDAKEKAERAQAESEVLSRLITVSFEAAKLAIYEVGMAVEDIGYAYERAERAERVAEEAKHIARNARREAQHMISEVEAQIQYLREDLIEKSGEFSKIRVYVDSNPERFKTRARYRPTR